VNAFDTQDDVADHGLAYGRADNHLVARGDTFLDDGEDKKIPSALPGVDDDAWTQFVREMAIAPLTSVSRSNALGMFAIMPRRLADFGLVKKLQRTQSANDPLRTIWVAVFVPPLTCEMFLKNPQVQYRVFGQSMRDYAKKMNDGSIERDPRMSLSGALAILHRCGPSGLETWKNGDRFPETMMTYDRVAGVF
jgi:hypothetical protein